MIVDPFNRTGESDAERTLAVEWVIFEQALLNIGFDDDELRRTMAFAFYAGAMIGLRLHPAILKGSVRDRQQATRVARLMKAEIDEFLAGRAAATMKAGGVTKQ